MFINGLSSSRVFSLAGAAFAAAACVALPGTVSATPFTPTYVAAIFPAPAGTAAITAKNGVKWLPDQGNTFVASASGSQIQGFGTGNSSSMLNTHITDGEPLPALEHSASSNGNITERVTGLTPGQNYLVNLDFAEPYFGNKVAGFGLASGGPGSRKFDVAINGKHVLINFDIDVKAHSLYGATNAPAATPGSGADEGITESFYSPADSSGNITIVYSSGSANNPSWNGFSIETTNVPGKRSRGKNHEKSKK